MPIARLFAGQVPDYSSELLRAYDPERDEVVGMFVDSLRKFAATEILKISQD